MSVFRQLLLLACLLFNSQLTFGQSPSFTIDDVSGPEGSASGPEGSVTNGILTFTVTLMNYEGGVYRVDVQTVDGSALAGQDYQAFSTTLIFDAAAPTPPISPAPPPFSQAQFEISLIGDSTFEPDEFFRVVLSNPSAGTTISDGEGIGTIQNDDAPPPSPTPTPSPTPAPTPTATPTPSPTPTPIPTPAPTPVATPTPSPTPTPIPTSAPTPVATPTPSPTPTPIPTSAPTPGATPTPSPTPTPIPTSAPTPGATPAPSPTSTPTPSTAATSAPSSTPSPTPVISSAPTPTPLNASLFLDVQPAISQIQQTQNWFLQINAEEIDSYQLELEIISGPGMLDSQLEIDENCLLEQRSWLCSWPQTAVDKNFEFSINNDRAGDTAVRAKLSTSAAERSVVLYSQSIATILQVQQETRPGRSLAARLSASGNHLYRVGNGGLDQLEWPSQGSQPLRLLSGDFDHLELLSNGNIVVSGTSVQIFDTSGKKSTLELSGNAFLAGLAELSADGHEELLIIEPLRLLIHDLKANQAQSILSPGLINVIDADINSDGRTDLILISPNNFQSWLQAVDGSFEKRSEQTVSALGPAAFLDIDGDAQNELLLAEKQGNVSVWQLNSAAFNKQLVINSAPVLHIADSKQGLWLFTQNGGHKLLNKPIINTEPMIRATIVLKNIVDVTLTETDTQQTLLFSRADEGLDIVRVDDELQTEDFTSSPDSASGAPNWPVFILLIALIGRRRKPAYPLLVLFGISGLILNSPYAWSLPTLSLPDNAEQGTSQLIITLDEPPAMLAALLDDIDVSQWLVQKDTQWILALPTMLQPGKHRLQLYSDPTGLQADVVAQWVFDIPENMQTQFRYGLTTTVSGVQRLDASDSQRFQPKTRGEGSLDSNAEWQRAELRLAENAAILWNSEGPDPFELANGELQLDYRQIGIRAGDVQIMPEPRSRVIDSQQRRGIFGYWQGSRMSAMGFTVRPNPIQGFQYGFGLGNSNERSRGLAVDVTPVQTETTRLTINLSGQNTLSRIDPFEPASQADNEAASMSSQLAWGLWQLDSNVAVTQTNFPGFIGESDNAYALRLNRDSLQTSLAGYDFYWNASVEHARSGSFYGSLLNPSDSLDLRLNSWNSYLQWGRVATTLSAQDARDNVNKLAIGRVQNRYYLAAVDWLPPAETAWYGSPYAQVQISEQSSRQRLPAPDPFVPAVNQDYFEWQFKFGLDWSGLSLLMLNRNARNEDKTNQLDELQREYQIQISSNGYNFSPRVQLQPRLSWINNRFADKQLNQQTLAAGLSLFAELPWQLRAVLNAQYEESHFVSSGNDSRLWQVNPSLEWQTNLATESQLQFSLNANYNAFRQSGVVDESWVALLRMTLYWPWEYNNAAR